MARVIGHVVCTVKEATHGPYKLLVVQPVDDSGRRTEPAFVCIDLCQAGVGDHVLVLQEGNSIRSLTSQPRGAVDSAAVGFIDYVERSGRQHPIGGGAPSPSPGEEDR